MSEIVCGEITYYVMYAKFKGVKENKKVSPADASALVTLIRLKPNKHRHEDLFKKIGWLVPWEEDSQLSSALVGLSTDRSMSSLQATIQTMSLVVPRQR